jgi:predicted GNAT superfamily acetyltransferase
MNIRELEDINEFQRCLELQRECFGFDDINLLPPRCFIVFNSIGGLALGAFEGDRIIGFVNAIPGVRESQPYWHSQMMAVTREYRNAGVGSALKLAQREHALQRGIRRIEWTFDPLESRNAHLNLQKLGAIVRQYRVNYYGRTERDPELDTDRVVAEWYLDRPRVNPPAHARRIFIPEDIQSLKRQSPQSARDIQLRVRGSFQDYTAEGFWAAGFEKTDEWSAYLFVAGDHDAG